MSLEQEDIDGVSSFLEEIAEVNNVDYDAVLSLFKSFYKQIQAHSSSNGKPKGMLINKTRGAVDTYFINKDSDGENFIIIPFGFNSRFVGDWNHKIFKTREKSWDAGNGAKLIEEGKVMTDPEGRPLAAIEKGDYKTEDRWIADGKLFDEEPEVESTKVKLFTPTGGLVWTKDCGYDYPIWRDERIQRKGYDNWNYSKSIRHRYHSTLYGLAFRKDDTDMEDARLFEKDVTGDQCDPKSDKFFFKTYEPFVTYNAIENVKENGTSEIKFVFTSKQNSFMTLRKSDFEFKDINYTLQQFFKTLSEYEENPGMYLYGTKRIKEFHDKFSIKDEEGNPSETASGYERFGYNNFGILNGFVTKRMEPRPNDFGVTYIISSSRQKRGTFVKTSDNVVNHPNGNGLKGRYLMLITTSATSYVKDKITGEKTYDPENKRVYVNVHSMHKIETKEEDNLELNVPEGIDV